MSMQLIEFVEVTGSSVAEIDFTSIAADYTDLMLVISMRSDSDAEVTMQFNGVTSGWSSKNFSGNGTSASSNSDPYAPSMMYVGAGDGSGQTASTFSSHSVYIPNYASSNYKSVSVDSVMENNATFAYMNLLAGLWSNTAAVTSIKLRFHTTGRNFVVGTTATLYGITAGSDGTTAVS